MHTFFSGPQGPIHTGRKQMEPVDVNGGVHTAGKQHQRKKVRICVRVASRILCGLGPRVVRAGSNGNNWPSEGSTHARPLNTVRCAL